MTGHRILTSRTGRILVFAGLLVLGWHAWLAYQASGKFSADLETRAYAGGVVDLRVTLRFSPERFHILMFQSFGRVSGTEGNTIDVRGVSAHRIWDIAKLYWVQRITLLQGD